MPKDSSKNHTCPVCQTPGFSLRGMVAHHCDGLHRITGRGERIPVRRLTAEEISLAIATAKTEAS